MRAKYDHEASVLYISHLDKGMQRWVLPSTPVNITDTMTSTFQETNALGRSAPVLTYSNSGPRRVQINLSFRIDAFEWENRNNNSIPAPAVGDYYFDGFLHALQSVSLPKYDTSNKVVEPPLVALRLSNEVFIKGVVSSDIGVTYSLPIIYGNRYAGVEVSFTVTEVDPYDASAVFKNGSFRGVVKTLRDIMWPK
jgi:hypothetical protein